MLFLHTFTINVMSVKSCEKYCFALFYLGAALLSLIRVNLSMTCGKFLHTIMLAHLDLL